MSQVNYMQEGLQANQTAMFKYLMEGWESHKAGEGRICWTVAAFPLALIEAFDVLPFLPEGDSASVAGMKAEVDACRVAEGAGYSRDLCSYARINLGRVIENAGLEEGMMPPPDFLVTGRTCCTTYVQWWETLARHYDIPLYVLDTPVHNTPPGQPVGKADETYFVERAEGLFRFMEEVTGNSFDQKEFDEALRCEKECSAIFREVLEQTKRRPSPVSLFDLLANAGLGYQFRCRPIGVELLLNTKKEIDERIADGVTGITNEKHRILFESNPPWFSMFDLQEWAAERDAVIVASSLPLALWKFSDFEGLTGMCNASTAHWGNWSLEHNLQNQKSLIEDWNCDGVMMMDNRGCKVIAFPVPETASYVENELGVPVMRFDGNMADSRDFDDQKVREQLNAFIDLLEERRQ